MTAPNADVVTMVNRRKVIVHIATSADGYIARPDGDIAWLTERPEPEGFYGLIAFANTIDVKVMGRKTFEISLELGEKFGDDNPAIVFSRQPTPPALPPAVEWVNEPIGPYIERLCAQPGKDVWMMGGGELIASFLDAAAIDEFVISIVPVFIGDGVPLIARRHRQTEMELLSSQRFADGLVQNHYRIIK
jgi:dihydrofolate reductase